MDVSVIGAGYLGGTHAACVASWGHDVVLVESDAGRLATFRDGRVPFHEPGLGDLVAEQVAAGRLRFTDDISQAAGCDLHFLCVGTPEGRDGAADLTGLEQAVDALAPYAGSGLVVGKSTVPVGTVAALQNRPAVRDYGVRIAWNPEFLREGSAVEDTLRPDRLVFGVPDGEEAKELSEVYRPLIDAGVPVVTTSLATAELAKTAANVMLAVRISLVNVLAETCERSGADMGELARVVGLDRRIGPHVLRPGIGYGGGCLPKDSRAFAARAAELGVALAGDVIDVVDRVNRHQPARLLARITDGLGGSLPGRRVAVLGASFKGGSDDLRESPAVAVIRLLLDAGADVRVYDPAAGAALGRLEPRVVVTADAESACRDAEAVCVLTDWPEFARLDPVVVRRTVARAWCLDGRQVIDPESWREAGWDVYVMGEGGSFSAR
jgi:UDPglucose 6-dehydrogenase